MHNNPNISKTKSEKLQKCYFLQYIPPTHSQHHFPCSCTRSHSSYPAAASDTATNSYTFDFLLSSLFIHALSFPAVSRRPFAISRPWLVFILLLLVLATEWTKSLIRFDGQELGRGFRFYCPLLLCVKSAIYDRESEKNTLRLQNKSGPRMTS